MTRNVFTETCLTRMHFKQQGASARQGIVH